MASGMPMPTLSMDSSANFADAIPITSPAELKIGPPEFPGLIAASVTISPSSMLVTVPKVTERSMPSGLPITITH